jgi:hypothetical protein
MGKRGPTPCGLQTTLPPPGGCMGWNSCPSSGSRDTRTGMPPGTLDEGARARGH